MSPAAQQERIQSMCKTLKLDRVAIDYGGLAQSEVVPGFRTRL